MNRSLWIVAAACLSAPCLRAQTSATNLAPVIRAVARADVELNGIPFADVVWATTGKKILPFATTNASDAEFLKKLGGAMDEVMRTLNQTNSAAQKPKRINEVSAHFEREIKEVLNRVAGFECDYPKLASGRIQRSGYPDLRLLDKSSGRIVYLDPKLFAAGSRDSSFRTFYFEPKTETNKILNDGHHLLVGFEHDGGKSGSWRFLGWELVDLSRFKVKLKAEFQGSNRDLYQEASVVGRSQPAE